ncbi:MAG: multiheme c-type cytochrome [Myxococcaceae bacterium]
MKRALLLAVALGGCKLPDVRPQAPRNPAQGIVFITTSLKGYLGPCGCSENMRGGIARAAFQVQQAQGEGAQVLLVDSGDALFGAEHLTEENAPQQKRKAQALSDALKLMGLNAKANGPLDQAAGKEFLDALRLPSMRDDVSVLDIAPGPNASAIGLITTADPAKLKELAQQAREKGARLVVALYQRPLADAQKLGMEDELGVDLLVVARAPGEADAELNKLIASKLPIAQAQAKGRSLLRLDVFDLGAEGRFVLAKGAAEQERELDAMDQRIEALRTQVNEPGLAPQLLELKKQKLAEMVARRAATAAAPPTLPAGKNAFTVRFVPLESSMPELAEVRDVVTRYDRDVGKLNLAWAQAHGRECPAPEAGQPHFTGDESCRDCHEGAFPIWEKSKHHEALATLEKKGKALHLDCVGCHVTGWQQPSGVCRIDKLEGHGQVGCESCHGPGSNHVEDPRKSNILNVKSPKVCVGCHDHENSPSFDFEKYLAQITGKGHGDYEGAQGKKASP